MPEGMTVVQSQFDPRTTITADGITVFARIDLAAGAPEEGSPSAPRAGVSPVRRQIGPWVGAVLQACEHSPRRCFHGASRIIAVHDVDAACDAEAFLAAKAVACFRVEVWERDRLVAPYLRTAAQSGLQILPPRRANRG